MFTFNASFTMDTSNAPIPMEIDDSCVEWSYSTLEDDDNTWAFAFNNNELCNYPTPMEIEYYHYPTPMEIDHESDNDNSSTPMEIDDEIDNLILAFDSLNLNDDDGNETNISATPMEIDDDIDDLILAFDALSLDDNDDVDIDHERERERESDNSPIPMDVDDDKIDNFPTPMEIDSYENNVESSWIHKTVRFDLARNDIRSFPIAPRDYPLLSTREFFKKQ